MRLLVLRPEPGATATLARAASAGLEAVAAPLFAVEAVRWAPSPAQDHDALMLTSANAVRHAGPGLLSYSGLPLYVVGEATAAAARAVGLQPVFTGADGAAALLARMAGAGMRAPLHLAGEAHVPADHPALSVTRRIVYRAVAASALSAAALAILADGAVALLHSPRAAATFASLCDHARLARDGIAVAAISPAAAAAAGAGWRAVATAAAPYDDALLAAASRLCHQDAKLEAHG